MFDGLYVLQGDIPFLHPILCMTIALGAVVAASLGRKLVQLLSPVIRTACRLIRFS